MDLEGADLKAIERACDRWRTSPNKGFPKVGELLALVRTITPASHEPIKAWAPLTDEEYDKASLSEKVEHHRHMQFEAECNAGPMCKKMFPGDLGHAATPDELPEKWHRWYPIAKNHAAEVSRLGRLLRESVERNHPPHPI